MILDMDSPTGQVRLLIGDTVENVGVKPDGSNFTDVEIAYFLEREGGSVIRAAALACETLAALWNTYPDFEADGLRINRSTITKGWQQSALRFRVKAGAKVVQVVRDDE